MKVFLVGGGTGGPTAPLLAVAEALAKARPGTKFFFIGNKRGAEKLLLSVSGLQIKYLTIPAGKWRRYFTLMNVVDGFKTVAGIVKSWYLLKKYRPDLIFGAGSFVQVPVAIAAFFLRVPLVIHQQDIRLLLATRLAAPFAKAVTVSFSYSSKGIPQTSGLFAKIPKSKIVVTGNPVRRDVLGGSLTGARKIFDLNSDYPTLLVLGGGAGSLPLNTVVCQALPELVKYVQVLHSTGGKLPKGFGFAHPHYHPFDFLGETLKAAYAAADIVLSRGGMSTISELSRLGKVAILVPLPESPQEENVEVLTLLRAAVGVSEEFFTPALLIKLVRKILWSADIQTIMREGIKRVLPHDADRKIANLLVKIYERNY